MHITDTATTGPLPMPCPTPAAPYAWACCACGRYGRSDDSAACLRYASRHQRVTGHRVRVQAGTDAHPVHLGAEPCKAPHLTPRTPAEDRVDVASYASETAPDPNDPRPCCTDHPGCRPCTEDDPCCTCTGRLPALP